MPNFIHSLDATNVQLLLDSLFKIKIPVYTVHDCFAATPNNMFTMENLVKEAFIIV
jgi:DNA-directed RNA polymerase